MKDLNEIKKAIKDVTGGEMIAYDTGTIVMNLVAILEDLVEYISEKEGALHCDRDKCPLSVKARVELLYGENVNKNLRDMEFETLIGGSSAGA